MTIVDGNELELLSKSKLSIYVFGALTPNYKKVVKVSALV